MDAMLLSILTMVAPAALNVATNRVVEVSVEKAFDAITNWFANVIRKRPELYKAVEQMKNNPQNPVAQAEFEKQVLKLLDEDRDQVRQLLKFAYLSDYTGPMRRVTEKFDDMKRALASLGDSSSTTEGRLHQAASLYALASDVERLDHRVFPLLTPLETTVARGMRAAAVISMKAYAAFILMRDKGIETALAELPDDHLLRPFRDFFHSGTAQHLRNAIGAGSFVATKYFDHLVFFDEDWQAYADTSDFLELCDSIRLFYGAIYLNLTGQ